MKEFNDSDFHNEISTGTVVVDFYAEWCQPCRMLAPVFERVAGGYGHAKFGKLDVDSNPQITEKYKISSLPTIIVFKDGQPVEKLSGLVAEKKLSEAVQKSF